MRALEASVTLRYSGSKPTGDIEHYRKPFRLPFHRHRSRHGTFGLAGIVYVGPFLTLPSCMTISI